MMTRQSPYRAQAERFDVFFEQYDAPLVPPEMLFDEGEDRTMEDAEAFVVLAVPGESAPPPPAKPWEILVSSLAGGVALLIAYVFLLSRL